MKGHCLLKEHEACCCTCRFRKPALRRGKPWPAGVRGWVCWAPELEYAQTGHPEHSLCEMFQRKEGEDGG